METTILLIRNGQPEGGEKMGLSDAPLLKDERERMLAQKRMQSPVKLVYTPPSSQYIETAQLRFPSAPVILMDKLSALDMGCFNGQRYQVVKESAQFEEWARTQDVNTLGNGESPYHFRTRCGIAFRQITNEMQVKGIESVAICTHRIVISAILQRFHQPRRYYKDWTLEYGQGYEAVFDTGYQALQIKSKLF